MPLVAAGVFCTSLTLWTLKVQRQSGTVVQEALNERDRARQLEAEVELRLSGARREEAEVKQQRDRARREEKAARRSGQNIKEVLAFFRNNVFSAPGHPASWSREGLGEKVQLRQAIDAAESKIAGEYPDRQLVEATIREILGATYLGLGEKAKAIQQYEQALALLEAELGPDDPDTGDCRNQLAVAYRRAGRHDKASRLFSQNVKLSANASTLAVQGSMLLSQKKPVQAELKLRESLTIRQKIHSDDWTTFDVMSMLGEALLNQGRFADAEPLLLSGYEGMKQRQDEIKDKVRLTQALERLVQLYQAWGKKENDESARWRKALEETKAAKKH